MIMIVLMMMMIIIMDEDDNRYDDRDTDNDETYLMHQFTPEILCTCTL